MGQARRAGCRHLSAGLASAALPAARAPRTWTELCTGPCHWLWQPLRQTLYSGIDLPYPSIYTDFAVQWWGPVFSAPPGLLLVPLDGFHFGTLHSTHCESRPEETPRFASSLPTLPLEEFRVKFSGRIETNRQREYFPKLAPARLDGGKCHSDAGKCHSDAASRLKKRGASRAADSSM